jgi:hypothetical protein
MKKVSKSDALKTQLQDVPAASPVLLQRLFEEQLTNAVIPTDFVHPSFLAARFREHPDHLLAEMGGTRVEVAIGVDRTMYQLEVAIPNDQSAELTATWVVAETSMRRPKPSTSVRKLSNKVPVTLDAAITSLCETFGLCKDTVLKAGVNLLAFWEGIEANERLELPMSKDWHRYSLANMPSNTQAAN